MGRYEILEHTADVGLAVEGDSLTEVFEVATRGLAEISGLWRPGRGDRISVEVHANDLGSLLVDWLSEVLYLHDARRALIGGVEVTMVAGHAAAGAVAFAPFDEETIEGVQIKAVTYHQLSVEKKSDVWRARVFFDI
jgi:SHS2 domain-containing protein